MNESITPTTKQFTCCASLAALGIKLRELKLFEPIEHPVQIAQKTIKDSPSDKLYDAFISLLAGAHGLVEFQYPLASGYRLAARLWAQPVCRAVGGAGHDLSPA